MNRYVWLLLLELDFLWLTIGIGMIVHDPSLTMKFGGVLAWITMFGFPCLLASYALIHKREKALKKKESSSESDANDLEAVETVKNDRSLQEKDARPSVEFVDRYGQEVVGTPDEREEWKRVDHMMRTNFVDCHPREFEEFVAELLGRMGYVSHLTPYSKDYGADVIAEKEGRRIVVEVKKYEKNHLVKFKEVKSVLGAIEYYHAQKAIFITTSDFKDEVYAMAATCPVELWNGSKLEELVKRHFIKADQQALRLAKTREFPSEEAGQAIAEEDAYRRAHAALSKEEADLQETQEVDMNDEDEDEC